MKRRPHPLLLLPAVAWIALLLMAWETCAADPADDASAAIAKLRAQRDDLAAQVEQLKSKLPSAPPVVTPPAVFGDLHGLGLNLTEHTDYTPGAPFANLAHSLRRLETWDGKSVYAGPATADGYPLSAARTLVHGYDLPDGDYPLSFAGKVTIQVTGIGKLNPDGRSINIQRARANGGKPILWLYFSGQDAADPFRDLSIRIPGVPAEQTFNPAWLGVVKLSAVIRFMDWGSTNANDLVNWSDRTRPTALVQTGYWFPRNVPRAARSGVAYEYWIELCAVTGRPAWINVPGQASDEYVRQMAVLFRDRYPKSLPLIVEWDNEPWNTDPRFSGPRVKAKADAAGRTHPRQIAVELLRVVAIWREVWGVDSTRLKFVLGSQASNPWVTTEALDEIAKAGKPSDLIHAVAIAPYIGGTGASPDAYVANLIDQCSGTWGKIAQHRQAAEAVGLKLWVYEGGAHPNSDAEGKIATTHPRMGEFVAKYWEFLKRNLGDDVLACRFCGPYDAKWGDAPSAEQRGEKFAATEKISQTN